jgi:mediator of RNA polymerase II transcription subunit 16
LPKIVVTVHTAQFGRILCFAFSDGTVQFRDRFTMEELYREQNTDTISSPLQVGFQFINDTPCELSFHIIFLITPSGAAPLLRL